MFTADFWMFDIGWVEALAQWTEIKRALTGSCRIIAISLQEREAVNQTLTELSLLSQSPFNQYLKMSPRKDAALIDPRQETNGKRV